VHRRAAVGQGDAVLSEGAHASLFGVWCGCGCSPDEAHEGWSRGLGQKAAATLALSSYRGGRARGRQRQSTAGMQSQQRGAVHDRRPGMLQQRQGLAIGICFTHGILSDPHARGTWPTRRAVKGAAPTRRHMPRQLPVAPASGSAARLHDWHSSSVKGSHAQITDL
jgi:hypothetical protein